MAFKICGKRQVPHRLDSRWSWLVCFCATFSQTVNIGIVTTFGVLFPVIIERFGSSRERIGELYAIVLTNLWTEPDVFKHRVISFVYLCSTKDNSVSLLWRMKSIFVQTAVFHGLCRPTWLPCKPSIKAKLYQCQAIRIFPTEMTGVTATILTVAITELV